LSSDHYMTNFFLIPPRYSILVLSTVKDIVRMLEIKHLIRQLCCILSRKLKTFKNAIWSARIIIINGGIHKN
jgi:hypothetical protein